MTLHTSHPDTHTHGLADDCPRCAEHAIDPVFTLDDANLARIVRLACSRTKRFDAMTRTDLRASTVVLNLLERVGPIARVEPHELTRFLKRYGYPYSPPLADPPPAS